MAQPQLATGRIVQKYTVSGRTHRAVANVRGLTLVGGVYQINSRTLDANDTVWTDAANGWFETVSFLAPLATTWSDTELWEKVGTAWVLRATFTPIATDHKSGDPILAGQHTLTLRDTLFYFLKAVVLDSSAGDIPKKYTTLASLPTQPNNWAKQFTSSNTIGHAPYTWMVSDSDHYINTAPFVGVVTTFNRQLRRARGLA